MRTTRTLTFGLVAVCLAGLLATAGVAVGEPPKPAEPAAADSPADRIAQLERQVAELSRENVRLRREKADAQKKLALAEEKEKALRRALDRRTVRMVPPSPPLSLYPGPQQVPDSWVPQEYNGIPFYLVPLEAGREVGQITGTAGTGTVNIGTTTSPAK